MNVIMIDHIFIMITINEGVIRIDSTNVKHQYQRIGQLGGASTHIFSTGDRSSLPYTFCFTRKVDTVIRRVVRPGLFETPGGI
jgi:hypothetical protein